MKNLLLLFFKYYCIHNLALFKFMKNDSYLLSIHNIIVYVTNREEITRESVYTNEAWRNLCKDPKIFNKEDFQRVWRDSILGKVLIKITRKYG